MRSLKAWKDQSRINWATELESNQVLDNELLKLGAILRIADAVELMAKNYLSLQSDLKFYKNKHEELLKENHTLRRRNAGLKSFNSRMKKERSNELSNI